MCLISVTSGCMKRHTEKIRECCFWEVKRYVMISLSWCSTCWTQILHHELLRIGGMIIVLCRLWGSQYALWHEWFMSLDLCAGFLDLLSEWSGFVNPLFCYSWSGNPSFVPFFKLNWIGSSWSRYSPFQITKSRYHISQCGLLAM